MKTLQDIQDEIMVIYDKLTDEQKLQFYEFLQFLDDVCDEDCDDGVNEGRSA